ncbi:MAG: TetR/AcrR family transcriptional regulator [Pseudomonadota bacterium]
MSLKLKKKPLNSKTGPYSFTGFLKRKINKAPAIGPEASVTALLLGTVNTLSTKRYSDLRVEEIVKASGVSRATFYNHFDSKLAICHEVFTEYSKFSNEMTPPSNPNLHPFDEIFQISLNFTKLICANAALHRRFVELSAEIPIISALWDEHNAQNIESIPRRLYREDRGGTEQDRIADTFLIGSVLHENIYGLYVTGRTPAARMSIKSPEHLAYRASLMMYRAEYLAEPPSRCEAHQYA